MPKHPFFTIITPVYNRSSIVADTINSVLAQTDSDFEYILVNDGSSDDSMVTLKNFEDQDERIKVIDLKENRGRCYARNTGLQNALGSWICYLDSDDLYYENHLATMRELIKANEDQKAFAVDQHINGQLKQYKSQNLHAEGIQLTINEFIENNPLTANQVCHSSQLKTTWSQERIPISEDWLFFRELSLETSILKKAIVTNNLQDHSDRSMNTTNAEKFVEFNLKAAEKFISDNAISKSIENRVRSYTLILCANVLLKEKSKKKAFALIKKSAKILKSYSYLSFYKALVKFFI